jgi:hypothetical protein
LNSGEGKEEKKPSWKRLLVLTLTLRVFYSAFAAAAALIQPVNWRLVHSNALTENLLPPQHNLNYLLLGVWERFDTLWYLHIALHGYDRPEAIVFFPLYPLLIRLLSIVMQPVAAALLISTTAAFFAIWALRELMAFDYAKKVVNRSVIVCAAWPASFIFFAGYAESLLMALILSSLWMAAKNRWLLAIILGMLAALTKGIGVVVILPLLLIAVQRRRSMILPMLLLPAGLIAYFAYLQRNGQRSIGVAYAQYWRTIFAAPWKVLGISISTFVHHPNPILAMNLFCLIAVCILAGASRAKPAYVIYAAGAVGIILCKQTTPPLQSMMRYVLVIFPAYAGFARLLSGQCLSERFGLVCTALFVLNLELLWLFLGWSLVV